MDSVEASALLGITLPIPLNTLKTTFRRLSREEHPDVSQHPQATFRFAQLNTAYNLLLKDPAALEFTEEDARKLETAEGIPLAKLGKGLGPHTNGRPCDFCDAKGYRSYRNNRLACPDCKKVFFNIFNEAWAYRCRKCKGSGIFKKDGRIVGECYSCKATGWHVSRHRSNQCGSCHGSRTVDDPKAKMFYTKCENCKGCGELMVFNPVLPKGLLNSR